MHPTVTSQMCRDVISRQNPYQIDSVFLLCYPTITYLTPSHPRPRSAGPPAGRFSEGKSWFTPKMMLPFPFTCHFPWWHRAPSRGIAAALWWLSNGPEFTLPGSPSPGNDQSDGLLNRAEDPLPAPVSAGGPDLFGGFRGLRMTRRRGSSWMKRRRTHGAIRWVWGDLQCTFSTNTVTTILKRKYQLSPCGRGCNGGVLVIPVLKDKVIFVAQEQTRRTLRLSHNMHGLDNLIFGNRMQNIWNTFTSRH